MKRIAIVALLFPPIQQIGARRPLRLANYLVEQGNDVTVYAVHPRTPALDSYCRVDASLLGGIDSRVRVVRTPSFHGSKILLGWRDRVRRWRSGTASGHVKPTAEGPAAEMTQSKESAPGTGLKEAISRLMDVFDVPDTFSGWIVTTLPVILARSIGKRPDAIYVTAPPWSPLVLAVLAGKILHVPVHVDFRDPWTVNPYVKATPTSTKIERWVLRNSHSIIANTESMAEDFRRACPALSDRVLTLYNGYEEATRRRIEDMARRVARDPGGPFVVSHVGTLYPARMPRAMARLLASVAQQWRVARPIRFRFIGPVWEPAPLLEEFAAAGVSSAVQLAGEVSSEQALVETVSADVLLLLQLGTRQQVPAKIFEYAFSGNPLLCAADRDSETLRLVAGYGLGKVIDEQTDSRDVLDYLVSLADRRSDTSPGPRFLGDFDGSHLAQQMARVMAGENVTIQV
jgi:glycosyltransferase involved in cell wall biosynthesis